MCDDQLRFFLFLVLLSRRPKSWIFSSSPIFDKSQISLFSWALVLDLHRLHGCREERCPCSSSSVVAKKNVWSGRRISRRAIHNYFLFFFFFINGSSKESKPFEAHPRIFFLSLLLLPMTRVNPIELFFYGRFRLLLIEQKFLRHCLHETMSTSWKLRRKSLTVIIILGGRLERRKELVGRFESSLRWRDGSQRWWERTFDWIVRAYLLDDLLGIRKCRICLSEEIYS